MKIRCIVVQLARLGDTLQSLMALRAAKQLYPDLEIHLLARERFAEAAKRVPWIENVITLPSESILGPILSGEKTQSQGVQDLARWISPIVDTPWDLAVNWSYSDASSYITALLPARIKLGYTRRRDTTFSCADGWSHYIQAIVQGGIRQDIHLTDIFTTQLLTALQIHYGEPSTQTENSPVTSKGFFKLELNEEDSRTHHQSLRDITHRVIAIQLGAGHASKIWSPEKWAKFAALLLKRHSDYSLVILGDQRETGLADRFTAEAQRLGVRSESILSMVGQTSFDLWASVISRAQWLIAGDTAAIHLASVLGTRVLNLSLGGVRFEETGPYGNGHYIVSSALPCSGCDAGDLNAAHTCGASIHPEAVYAVWSYASGEWAHRRALSFDLHAKQLGMEAQAPTIRTFRSRIRTTQEGGGVFYEPVVKRPLPLSDWSSMVMGHVARAWYCGWVPPVGQELQRETIGSDLIQSLRALDESSDVLIKICEEARRTAQQMNRKCTKLKSEKLMDIHDRDELRDLGQKLMELDGLVERLAKTHPALGAFSRMSKVLMHNLRGNQLSDLARDSANSYRQIREGAGILKDWITHTLELAKLVAIKGPNLVALSSSDSNDPSKELSP